VVPGENILHFPPPAGGLLLKQCLAGSPADTIGLQAGDIVLYVNGLRVDTFADYLEARRVVSDRIDVRVFRDNQFLDLRVELGCRPET